MLFAIYFVVGCVYLFVQFDKIYGHDSQIKALRESISLGRVPHAQLFTGSEGVGMLSVAIAFMRAVFCQEPNADELSCDYKFDRLIHPDLHFVFPVASNAKVKTRPTSDQFLEEWRLFVKNSPFGTLFDWYQQLEIENKQGQIGVLESEEITKKLSLTAYEGGWKGVIVWQADKLNLAAANKLLKLVEEPPEKTLLIFISNHEDEVLETLRSRCQGVHFSLLPENAISKALISFGATRDVANSLSIQANGQLSRALRLMKVEQAPFEDWFVSWVRTTFKAKRNKGSVVELLNWSQQIAALVGKRKNSFCCLASRFFVRPYCFSMISLSSQAISQREILTFHDFQIMSTTEIFT